MCLAWLSAHIFMAFLSQLGDIRDWRSVLCTPIRQIPYTNPSHWSHWVFRAAFPRIKPHLLTLASNFQMPIYRNILMACSVSQQSFSNILKVGPGNTIAVGGAAESLSAHPGTADLTLKWRWVGSRYCGCMGDYWYWWSDMWVGWIHQACNSTWVMLSLQLFWLELAFTFFSDSADLVPLISFGENEVRIVPSFSLLRGWTVWMTDIPTNVEWAGYIKGYRELKLWPEVCGEGGGLGELKNI